MIEINMMVIMIGALIYLRVVMTDEDISGIAGTIASFLIRIKEGKPTPFVYEEEGIDEIKREVFTRPPKTNDELKKLLAENSNHLENIGITNAFVGDGCLRGDIAGIAQIVSSLESSDDSVEAPIDSDGNIKRKIAPLESGQKTITEAMDEAKEFRKV